MSIPKVLFQWLWVFSFWRFPILRLFTPGPLIRCGKIQKKDGKRCTEGARLLLHSGARGVVTVEQLEGSDWHGWQGIFGSFPFLHQLLWKGSTDGWFVLDVVSSYWLVVNAIVHVGRWWLDYPVYKKSVKVTKGTFPSPWASCLLLHQPEDSWVKRSWKPWRNIRDVSFQGVFFGGCFSCWNSTQGSNTETNQYCLRGTQFDNLTKLKIFLHYLRMLPSLTKNHQDVS